MEQESQAPLLYGTLRRVGYKLALAVHAIFMAVAILGAIILVTALVASRLIA